jgi:rubredoxin
MPKMVCVNCQTEFRPFHNGTTVVEMASFGPYKVWAADSWKCPGCGTIVEAGFSDQPVMEHYEEGFQEWFEQLKKDNPDSIVYDYERPVKN